MQLSRKRCAQPVIVRKNWHKITVKKTVIVLSIISSLLIQSNANAATKPLAVKNLSPISTSPLTQEVPKMLVAGNTIVLYGSENNTGYLRAIKSDGTEIWKISLASSQENIATAAALGPDGSIWVAGSISLVQASDTNTIMTPTPPINPDGVVAEPTLPLRGDLNGIALWKVSPAGQVLGNYYFDCKTTVLVTAIAVNAQGISIVGMAATENGNKGFLANSNNQGIISPPIYLGAVDTALEDVQRFSDGTIVVAGSSGETLAGKKVAAIHDGILARFKNNKVTSLIRSSANKTSRSWRSVTNSLFLGGYVQSGNKFESALTKFSPTFVPSWTYRFASNGTALTLTTSSNSHFAFLGSTGAVKGLSTWKPVKATGLLLAFDGKGLITGAYSAPGTSMPAAIGYSKELGVIVLGYSQTAVSIFRLITR